MPCRQKHTVKLPSRAIWKRSISLGLMYEIGNGVEQDDTQAAAWYQKSAQQGYAPGQYKVAAMYMNGVGGLTQDYTENGTLAEAIGRAGLYGSAAGSWRRLFKTDSAWSRTTNRRHTGSVLRRSRAAQRHRLCSDMPMITGKAWKKMMSWRLIGAQRLRNRALLRRRCILRICMRSEATPCRIIRKRRIGSGRRRSRVICIHQLVLGYMYDVGMGITADGEQAAYWYTQAAEQGQYHRTI